MTTTILNPRHLSAALRAGGTALALLLATPLAFLHAQSVTITGPTGSGLFGTSITVLPNGNYVVADPGYDNGATPDVGAVYLYNGSTNALISTLTGTTANDRVGNGGVALLTNGNYVVRSSDWGNGAVTNAGAVTWGSGTTGVSGVVSAANSLVGSKAYDYVGIGGVTALTNGHYVVSSYSWGNGTLTYAGAVTWGNGTAGVSGVVSATNSLVGSKANDYVGIGGVTALTNSHYVVSSSNWGNGTLTQAGAVTWGSGTTGVSGVVSAANSLVGSKANDQVGNGGVTALSNSKYIMRSSSWDNGTTVDAGAITLGDGTGGTVGPITSCNSSVGSVGSRGSSLAFSYNATTDKLLVGLPYENKVVIGVGTPAAPTGAATQSGGTGATVANLSATGTAIQWYAAATGGTALAPTTPLTGGTTYYATQTVAGCESAARLAVSVAVPLPVELLTFTATLAGPVAVRLAWATASEKNSATFEVERSLDGSVFERIGTVAAAGSSTAPRAYELPDTQLPTGAARLYYRLKQVDMDGTFSYSPVRTVALKGAGSLALFPNPAPGGAATLTGTLPGTVVTVFDALGRPVTSAPADATGTAALVLPAGLPVGMYVVRAGTQALRLTVE